MIRPGDKYGRLIVIEYAQSTAQGRRLWKCQCDCGNIVIVRGNHLTSGNTKSCGCLSRQGLVASNARRERPKDELKYEKRLRNIRDSMLKRCYNPSRVDYKYYGGKGVSICDEWRSSFQSFYQWAMASGYEPHLTIERKDNDGNYEPSNCIWATTADQNKHRSNRKL